MNLQSRKNRYVLASLAVMTGVFFSFQNFTSYSAEPAPPHRHLTAVEKQAVEYVFKAHTYKVAAEKAATPELKERYEKQLAQVAQDFTMFSEKAADRGEIQAKAGPSSSCEVVNSECPQHPEDAATTLHVHTSSAGVCLKQAAAYHQRCGGVNTATFYENGYVQDSRVSGSACKIMIRKCDGHQDLVGVFNDSDSGANQDAASCSARAAYYQSQCKAKDQSEILAAFYHDGALVRSNRDN